MALARFLCWERSAWHATTMPVGTCVRRTADSVLLTCWPPAPLERYTSMRTSAGLISMSMSSSISGETNTEANEVCRRAFGIERRLAHQAMHAGLGAQPAVRVVAGEVDARALDARDFAVADVDDLGLEAALLAPAQVHAQQHLRPVLRLGAAGPGLDVEERAVRVHLARKHALEFELLDVALERREVALDGLRRRFVVLFDSQVQQLAGVLQPAGHAVERG